MPAQDTFTCAGHLAGHTVLHNLRCISASDMPTQGTLTCAGHLAGHTVPHNLRCISVQGMPAQDTLPCAGHLQDTLSRTTYDALLRRTLHTPCGLHKIIRTEVRGQYESPALYASSWTKRGPENWDAQRPRPSKSRTKPNRHRREQANCKTLPRRDGKWGTAFNVSFGGLRRLVVESLSSSHALAAKGAHDRDGDKTTASNDLL